ncbi:MAG: ATP-dependent zinc protease family protein [Phycisphaerales bacterium]
MDTNQPIATAGWRERIDLPEWGLRRVRAKLDTGARTSAIDVAQFEMIDDEHVRFEIVYRDRPIRKTKWVTARVSRVTKVKPSNGQLQERVVCLTTIKIGEQLFETEIGLVCRKGMLCRMLIGRSTLAGHFQVDSSRKYVITPKKSSAPKGSTS